MQVIDWVCGHVVNRFVFDELLDASLTGGVNLVATEIFDWILQGSICFVAFCVVHALSICRDNIGRLADNILQHPSYMST